MIPQDQFVAAIPSKHLKGGANEILPQSENYADKTFTVTILDMPFYAESNGVIV